MATPSPARGPARETRLLLLTLGVSIAVLFLLARFRFPERPISELATPQPLARLARTTTFDELSATLTDLLHRAGEATATLRVSAEESPDAGAGVSADRLVPALRVRDNLALAVLPGDARIDAIDGEAPSSDAVFARDEVRGLVLVRVPARPAPSLSIQPRAEPLQVPGFLAVINAAPGGPAIRAEFVSRIATQPHPAWDANVIGLGGVTGARPGAMVFTLDGRFVGMVLRDGEETLVAPGDALMARADRLTRGESVLAANAGLAVQPLSPALAKATKAANGVIIAAVEGTAASSSLRVGDVIAAVDDDQIRSVGDWERVLGRRAPGTTVRLRVIRRDAALQVPLVLTWRTALLTPGNNRTAVAADGGAAAAGTATGATAATPARRSDFSVRAAGLSLRAVPGGGALEVLRVDAGSAAARGGLRVGDRLIALPGALPAPASTAPRTSASAAAAPATTPLTIAKLEAAFKALPSGDALVLAITRAGQPLVVAVEKP